MHGAVGVQNDPLTATTSGRPAEVGTAGDGAAVVEDAVGSAVAGVTVGEGSVVPESVGEDVVSPIG